MVAMNGPEGRAAHDIIHIGHDFPYFVPVGTEIAVFAHVAVSEPQDMSELMRQCCGLDVLWTKHYATAPSYVGRM